MNCKLSPNVIESIFRCIHLHDLKWLLPVSRLCSQMAEACIEQLQFHAQNHAVHEWACDPTWTCDRVCELTPTQPPVACELEKMKNMMKLDVQMTPDSFANKKFEKLLDNMRVLLHSFEHVPLILQFSLEHPTVHDSAARIQDMFTWNAPGPILSYGTADFWAPLFADCPRPIFWQVPVLDFSKMLFEWFVRNIAGPDSLHEGDIGILFRDDVTKVVAEEWGIPVMPKKDSHVLIPMSRKAEEIVKIPVENHVAGNTVLWSVHGDPLIVEHERQGSRSLAHRVCVVDISRVTTDLQIDEGFDTLFIWSMESLNMTPPRLDLVPLIKFPHVRRVVMCLDVGRDNADTICRQWADYLPQGVEELCLHNVRIRDLGVFPPRVCKSVKRLEITDTIMFSMKWRFYPSLWKSLTHVSVRPHTPFVNHSMHLAQNLLSHDWPVDETLFFAESQIVGMACQETESASLFPTSNRENFLAVHLFQSILEYRRTVVIYGGSYLLDFPTLRFLLRMRCWCPNLRFSFQYCHSIQNEHFGTPPLRFSVFKKPSYEIDVPHDALCDTNKYFLELCHQRGVVPWDGTADANTQHEILAALLWDDLPVRE